MASQTLPASSVHARPALDSGHGSLKKCPSTGDAQPNSLPAPDYHGYRDHHQQQQTSSPGEAARNGAPDNKGEH